MGGDQDWRGQQDNSREVTWLLEGYLQKTKTIVIDTVAFALMLKSMRILSEKELKTQMDRGFFSKIIALTLTEEGLDIYKAHLSDFSCDE